MPNMRDPRFEQAVILMLSHDAEHAMGLIINKPLEALTCANILEALDLPVSGGGDCPAFFGGPVETNRGFVVHDESLTMEDTLTIGDSGLGVTANKQALIALGADDTEKPAREVRSRLCLGYAGWSAGQLEDEIASNSWLHCDAVPSLVLSADHATIWRRTLETLGVREAMFSREWSQVREADKPLN